MNTRLNARFSTRRLRTAVAGLCAATLATVFAPAAVAAESAAPKLLSLIHI